MKRRDFLTACAAVPFLSRPAHASAPFPVTYRKQPAYAARLAFVEPGRDEFPGEKAALEIESRLLTALQDGNLPITEACTGRSPLPVSHRALAEDVELGEFGSDPAVFQGYTRWRTSLGKVRRARFYRMPGDLVRFDVASENRGRLEYRTGVWKQVWRDGRIEHFEPLEEVVASAATAWFRDVSQFAFSDTPSFRQQLLRGIPYWRAAIDPACGIDVYGENGIAVADIDGDGVDEIYICQPGGLPNRLFKNDGRGKLHDISREAGLDFLDDTASALFIDVRNSGKQDLILVRPSGPMLFLNDGKGRFELLPDAFRFATKPEGMFTCASAADYDQDGRLDLYLCCYFYFQSEAQYRYPVPYHDAQNGPPNFLFHNRFEGDQGWFEDVTGEVGLRQNNNRFSFASAWCDYNDDGWPDLYVTNDFGRKNLYRNRAGKFEDVAAAARVEDLGPGMSAAWLDYDGDGKADIVVSNMWSAAGQRIVNDPEFAPAKQDPMLRDAYRLHVKGNSLYRNKGDETFEYVGAEQGVEMGHWSWGCDGCDFDGDGVPEIYIACGMVTNNDTRDLMSFFYRQVVNRSPVAAKAASSYEDGWNAINQLIREEATWAGASPNVFYARRGQRFYDFSGVSGLDFADDSRAFAFIDIDGDGRMDLILKSRLGPQVRVLQNNRPAEGHRIGISLRGVKSNRDAIGARVDVDGRVKWLNAGSGYLSQHTKQMYFALEGERAAAVTVTWPSGLVQRFTDLATDHLHSLTEGVEQTTSVPLRMTEPMSTGPTCEPDNRSRLVTAWLREPVPLPRVLRGPGLVVLYAGEPLPRFDISVQAVDLRSAAQDEVAAWAIFRRYLFDYRVELQTPFWMLIDGDGRARRVYSEAPSAADARADLAALPATQTGTPFAGKWLGNPARDFYKIGAAMMQAGCGDTALPYLERARARNPENSRVLLAIGRLHLEANRLADAEAALSKATALEPNSAVGWNDLGGVAAAKRDPAQALAYFDKAIAVGGELPYVLINAAQAEAQRGNTAQSEALYRRALDADPASGEAANQLGLLLAQKGESEEAQKLFEKAISLRRDDASAINNLAVLYLNTGKTQDAIAAFQYGLRVAPDEEMLYMNLARTWVRLGQRERARQLMRELLDRKPGLQSAQNALRELETR